jgi:hypothetical protein
METHQIYNWSKNAGFQIAEGMQGKSLLMDVISYDATVPPALDVLAVSLKVYPPWGISGDAFLPVVMPAELRCNIIFS